MEGAERLCRRALRILEKNSMGYHVQAGAVLVALAGLLSKQVPSPAVLRVSRAALYRSMSFSFLVRHRALSAIF